MIPNLFGAKFLATDASLMYLSKIFGNVAGVLGQGGDINILSSMFKIFNSAILTIAVLMLLYITVIGILGTAHEGEFMGKKMNNIWIPIRAFLGIALLVPFGAGYCALQIIMMWIIVQGVGLADSVWDQALRFVDRFGSVYAQVSVPVTGADTAFQGLFSGLVCDASLKKGDPKQLGNYHCTNPNGCGTAPVFDPSKKTYDIPNCGSLTFCNMNDPKGGDCQANPDKLKCKACQAQVNTLTAMIPTFAGLAGMLVNADYSYRDFSVNSWSTENSPDWKWIYSYCSANGIKQDECCVRTMSPSATCKAQPFSNKLPAPNISRQNNQSASSNAVKNLYWPYYFEPVVGQDGNFIKTAITFYQEELNKAANSFNAPGGQADSQRLVNDVINGARANGWIFAGGLYYQLANLNSNRTRDSVADLSWTVSTEMPLERNNTTAASYLMAIAKGDTTESTSSPAGSEIDTSFTSVASGFQTNINSSLDTNPLLLLQVFGTIMLVIAEYMFLVTFALILALGIGGNLNIFVLGTGFDNPIGPWAMLVMVFLLPLYWGAMALLVSAGASLAIYTPLLPYIYFTFGALAWIIATVEAMVAGPLVALGIISPSGQHEIMGKAEPAILLLFNLFLRPTLMIFGLIVAMLLATVACMMVNQTFAYVMRNFAYPDPLTMVFILIAYVSLILAVLNKCFAVINLIPQQVIRWVGGHGDAVETPTEAIKGAIDSGAGKVGGGMAGGGDRAKAYGKGAKKEADAKKAGASSDAKEKGVAAGSKE